MNNLNELKRLALAATPGEWEVRIIRNNGLYGGGEDSSGALQYGQVDWDELRESIHAHVSRAAIAAARAEES